jgi:hypothetical protein
MATSHPETTRTVPAAQLPQYSFTRILGTWAAAALPMAALAWLVAPRLAHGFEGPTALPRALILALLAGLVWQFLLVLILVRRQQGSLRWAVVKDARGCTLRNVRAPAGVEAVALGAEELLPTLPTPATRDVGLSWLAHGTDVPARELGRPSVSDRRLPRNCRLKKGAGRRSGHRSDLRLRRGPRRGCSRRSPRDGVGSVRWWLDALAGWRVGPGTAIGSTGWKAGSRDQLDSRV